MEQKYIRVAADGELFFDRVAHGTLNERNIDEANAELAERAVNCRREAEHNIDKDIRMGKILLYIGIVFAGIVVIASTVMTIVLDWGIFIMIVLSGFMLLLCLLFLLIQIKEQKRNARIRDCGDLYLAQVVKSPAGLFSAKLQCACVIDGAPRLLKYRTNMGTFAALQKKDYIIIAYDKATEKFLPIRLFEKGDKNDR
ncbi:MAG: hypothetical protein K2O39_04600 [Clostridiales bacterium]|nr:hypothetical protein [Clostridiales bacterium]